MTVHLTDRIKFHRNPDSFSAEGASYRVVLIRDHARVELGDVIRARRSTDSKIAGTRLRRSGKGADEWVASVPAEEWQDHGMARVGRLQGTGLGNRQGYRLTFRGQRWDRRIDAAYALVAWHDHPEKREPTDS